MLLGSGTSWKRCVTVSMPTEGMSSSPDLPFSYAPWLSWGEKSSSTLSISYAVSSLEPVDYKYWTPEIIL